MSNHTTTCHGFVANTWRKDVCTNCFRTIEEHGISVSGRITGNKFNNSNNPMNKYSTGGGGFQFHSSSRGDNAIPRMTSAGATTTSSSGGGHNNNYNTGFGSANLTQSQFATGSISHSQLKQQQQQGFHNKSSLSGSGGGFNSNRQQNVTSGGGHKFRNMSQSGEGMDAKDGGTSGGRKPQFNVGGPIRGGQRGILKAKDGSGSSNKKSGGRRGVSFPKEVVEVIGIGDDDDEPYRGGGGGGGHSSSEEDDDDNTPIDPQDNSSIAELLEKNSTTMDEKEFHRLTQKNTNFNSIKTNLLGKTNIEIGPIVGGTKGSSKPLVSIGTFETRNEPLKIRHKIDEDSTDDYDKTVNNQRKYVVASTTTKTSAITATRSSAMATSSPPAQVPTSSFSTDSASKAMQNVSIGSSTTKSSSKFFSSSSSSSSSSNNTTVSKTVNHPTTTTTPIVTKSSDQVDSSSSSSSSSKSGVEHHKTVSISSAKDLGRWSREQPDQPKNEVSQGPLSKGPNKSEKPPLKPKSILKISQNSTSKITSQSTSPPPINNSIPPILSPSKIAEQQKLNHQNAISKSNTALTNLIILTEGNSIASKRTSFLRDIIDQGGKNSTITSSATNVTSTSSNAEGITIVKNVGVTNNASLDCDQSLIEKDSLDSPPTLSKQDKLSQKPKVPSKLKLNIDLSLNREVSNPPKSVVPTSLRFASSNENGSGTDSEFDDSLEDSGLDIKITKPRNLVVIKGGSKEGGEVPAFLSEESDENEKVGSSGSDSGNENDYTVSNNKCSGRVSKGHAGLYISVDEDEEILNVGDTDIKLSAKTPAKLSPDSVLSNSVSGSEMSASGSNESIAESLHEERRASTISTSSTSSKRQAPQPPNSEVPLLYDEDDVYDDVVNVKHRLSTSEDTIEDESIYDDCSTIADNDRTITSASANNQGKIGSYNFQGSSPHFGGGNHDNEDEVESVITHRSDGIEFIGIRKIDAESFLKERSPTPDRKFGFRRSVSPGKGSRERSSSTSPKTRRKVNQFFSTIGKKAGAAFSSANSQLGQYARTKSPSVFSGSNLDPKGGGEKSYNYKRSMSTDEVSATRAQEIYATVTPTTLKFKGVLNKLSKIDLNLSDKNKDATKADSDLETSDSKDKTYKKNHNISKSIKKFLRLGNKDGTGGDGGKYDFPIYNNAPLNISSPIHTPVSSLTSSSAESDSLNSSSNPASMTPSVSSQVVAPSVVAVATAVGGGGEGVTRTKPPLPLTKPPPPPPRVHSLDMLQKMGVVNQKGTVRPARPPPPVRPNQIAPSFTAVFNNPSASTSESTTPNPTISGDKGSDDNGIPPCKPRRKNSAVGGGSKDLETSYNHISNLNLETLKLIANQPLTKIVSNFPVISSQDNVQWSQFDIQTGMRPDPLIHGMGFAIYSAHFEGTKCLLMIQESTYASPLQFSCVQTDLTFQDDVPIEYVPWDPSDRVKCDIGIKATLSVLPFFKMWSVEDFLKSSEILHKEKCLALLQSLDYWGVKDLHDLIIFRQPHIVSSDRIYVHPIPEGKQKSGINSNSVSPAPSDFEVSIKQLLFTCEDSDSDYESILSGSDKRILIEKVSGAQDEVKSQLKLFFQLKLFAPSVESSEFLKIRKHRSEQSIQQWLDKERAMCMKEAVVRSVSGGMTTDDAITPLKKAYLDFLMRPGNSAKAILEMFVELFE